MGHVGSSLIFEKLIFKCLLCYPTYTFSSLGSATKTMYDTDNGKVLLFLWVTSLDYRARGICLTSKFWNSGSIYRCMLLSVNSKDFKPMVLTGVDKGKNFFCIVLFY